MKNKEHIGTHLDAFHSFFLRTSSLIAQLVGIIFVAYIVGWVRADAYYSTFGAKWLVGQLSQSELLEFSMGPFVILVIFWFSVSQIIVDSGIKEHTLWKAILLIGLLLLLFVVFDLLGFLPHVNYIFQVIELLLWAILISLQGNVVILLHLKEKLKQPSVLFSSIPFCCFLVLYLFPNLYGHIDALRDMDANTTTLEKVILKDSTDNNRLLKYNGNDFILVTLPDADKNIHQLSIRVVKPIQVTKIMGKEFLKNSSRNSQ